MPPPDDHACLVRAHGRPDTSCRRRFPESPTPRRSVSMNDPRVRRRMVATIPESLRKVVRDADLGCGPRPAGIAEGPSPPVPRQLAHAARRSSRASGSWGPESLVVGVVPVDDDIGVRPVAASLRRANHCSLPCSRELNRVWGQTAICATSPRRVEVTLEPADPGRSPEGSRRNGASLVEDDHVPQTPRAHTSTSSHRYDWPRPPK